MEANDDGDVVTEVVIVATDIEAPKADGVREVGSHGRNDGQQVPDFNEKTTCSGIDAQSLDFATEVAYPSLAWSMLTDSRVTASGS